MKNTHAAGEDGVDGHVGVQAVLLHHHSGGGKQDAEGAHAQVLRGGREVVKAWLMERTCPA